MDYEQRIEYLIMDNTLHRTELKQAQELIKKLCNYLGTNEELDHRLWQETRTYCKEKGLLK